MATTEDQGKVQDAKRRSEERTELIKQQEAGLKEQQAALQQAKEAYQAAEAAMKENDLRHQRDREMLIEEPGRQAKLQEDARAKEQKQSLKMQTTEVAEDERRAEQASTSPEVSAKAQQLAGKKVEEQQTQGDSAELGIKVQEPIEQKAGGKKATCSNGGNFRESLWIPGPRKAVAS